ncbi:MAG: LysE family translocator [Chitinophagaceae bacterium]|nr:LysE family translocator [Chitinophagaceae bacterium]
MKGKSSLFKAAAWGCGISWLGTLPLGTLNIAAMQVSVSEGAMQGIFFSLGVALVEVLYVRLSVVGIRWIMQRARLLYYLEWAAIAIVILLAFGSFWAAFQPTEEKSFLLKSQLPNFFLGVSLSAINPMQIPFWFGWTTVLFSKGVLIDRPAFYNSYTLGIGVGTILGLFVFVFGGAILVNRLNAGQSTINFAIGCIFTITALILMVKVFTKKPLDKVIAEKAAELEEAEHANPLKSDH